MDNLFLWGVRNAYDGRVLIFSSVHDFCGVIGNCAGHCAIKMRAQDVEDKIEQTTERRMVTDLSLRRSHQFDALGVHPTY